mmetsp:Transcript_20010/g.56498  ORF Transcript_20010/g.56498 Transcript_20010/m.56498 type:complete len:382 (+) Transcript_20010:278-1423(+)
MERFQKRLVEDLFALAPDEGREYPSLKRAERVVLQELVASIGGIWTWNEGQVVQVYRLGPIAEDIRERLEALKPGEVLELRGLLFYRAFFAKGTAEGLGLTVSQGAVAKDGSRMMTFFNAEGSLEEFAEGVERTLRGLVAGQVLDFAIGALSKARQEVLQRIASQLGLDCHDFGECLSIGNLGAFAEHVREVIRELRPGAVHTFAAGDWCPEHAPGEGLHALARHVVHLETNAEGISSSDAEDSQGRKVVNVMGQRVQDVYSPMPICTELDEEGIKENVRKLFGVYASGTQGRANIFLRKPDLNRLVSDSAAQRNRSIDKVVMEDIEQVYDETLELQVDMGSRVHRGITLEYFQVFMTKSATLLGWSLSSLLMALLEWYDR